MNKEVKYTRQNIGTKKASIFLINGYWYWIPRSIISNYNCNKKTFEVPCWFYNKMNKSLNYIY